MQISILVIINIIQNSGNCKNSDLVIIFWELCNTLEGFQYKVELFGNEDQLKLEKIKSEIDLVFKNLEETSIILLNKFTSVTFSYRNIGNNKFDSIVLELNEYLINKKFTNIRP